MEVQCLKVKLKKGTTDLVINWMKSLYDNIENVNAALINETMVVESMFLDRCEDADYLIFYTRAESLVKANQAMQNSTNPVDIAALDIISKTWESASVLEILFDIDRIASVKDKQ